MNQNMKIVNLTKGVITLVGKYVILPGKSITLTVLEYPQILSKINLQKQLGWIDWKFVPVDYLGSEVSPLAIEPISVAESQPVAVVSTEETPLAASEVKVTEPHPASPLIARKFRKLLKQEGDPKTDDTKGTV